MKVKIIIMIVTLSLCSCSTLKKSMIYGGLAGVTLGAVGGSSLSPDPASKNPNMLIWGSLGAVVGAGLGYLFFKDDPENMELPSMVLPPGKSIVGDEVIEKGVLIPSESKKYKVETEPLPDHLKGKVKNPFIIEHTIPERIEELKNGKTITIESHKAWEVSFE